MRCPEKYSKFCARNQIKPSVWQPFPWATLEKNDLQSTVFVGWIPASQTDYCGSNRAFVSFESDDCAIHFAASSGSFLIQAEAAASNWVLREF